ncbi:cell wall hydrolase [uncultured Sphingomonas sp.]|uniref:cell wall hydrolase n=1 Tax=uncultured Sphingomonas sp. TaxID=158754 RepID=UPI0035CC6225
MTFALGGLISTSTITNAAEIDRPALAPMTINAADNASARTLVPSVFPTLVPEILTAPKPVPATFSSLDAAVAAHAVGEAGNEEALRCLATTVYFESKGEPLAGQLAVAHVVLNRARSGRFASDVCGVVKQRGQFSFVRRGVLPAVDAVNRMYRTAEAVAKVALASSWKSPAPNALFFNGRKVGLPGRLTKVALIGNHIFYR